MSDEVRMQTLIGWVGLATTSSGDLVIYLYDEHPKLNFAMARVYQEEFTKLPPHLQAAIKKAIDADEVDEYMESAPTKSGAQNSGVMRPIDPPLCVPVKKKRIVWEQVNTKALASGANSGAAPSDNFVWTPLTDGQKKLAEELADDVSWLHALLWKRMSFAVRQRLDDYNISEEVALALYRNVSYDFAKTWPSVRGAIVDTNIAQYDTQVLLEEIRNSEVGDMLSIIAKHVLIDNEESAKAALKTIGETGAKSNPADRVEQAERVFMYIELVVRHGVDVTRAAEFVQQSSNKDVPF